MCGIANYELRSKDKLQPGARQWNWPVQFRFSLRLFTLLAGGMSAHRDRRDHRAVHRERLQAGELGISGRGHGREVHRADGPPPQRFHPVAVLPPERLPRRTGTAAAGLDRRVRNRRTQRRTPGRSRLLPDELALPRYYDVTGTNCLPNKWGYSTDPAHRESTRITKNEVYQQVKELRTSTARSIHSEEVVATGELLFMQPHDWPPTSEQRANAPATRIANAGQPAPRATSLFARSTWTHQFLAVPPSGTTAPNGPLPAARRLLAPRPNEHRWLTSPT
jgi:hypothetical protein